MHCQSTVTKRNSDARRCQREVSRGVVVGRVFGFLQQRYDGFGEVVGSDSDG